MTEETETPEDNKPETTKDKVVAGTKKTVEVVEKVGATAEVASNAFGMVKWVAIAVVTLSVLGGGAAIYKTITKPVAAVTDAGKAVAEKVTGGVGAIADKAGDIKDGATSLINHGDIPVSDQAKLNQLAEAAFATLFKMDGTKPDGVRERMYRRTNFGGSGGKICKQDLDYGGGPLLSYAAADVDAHETAAQLGSKDDRLIRMIIRASDDDIKFNAAYNSETGNWEMNWSKGTIRKPVSGDIADARIMDILAAVPENCK